LPVTATVGEGDRGSALCSIKHDFIAQYGAR